MGKLGQFSDFLKRNDEAIPTGWDDDFCLKNNYVGEKGVNYPLVAWHFMKSCMIHLLNRLDS